MARQKWTSGELSALLTANGWSETTGVQGMMPGLQKSMRRLMPGTMCDQICPMFTHGRANVWEASGQAGVMTLIAQLQNPCLGVIISNDELNLWTSTWSIFNPEATEKESDHSGAVFVVLRKPKAVAHFTGMNDVGLTGEKFATRAPTYQLVTGGIEEDDQGFAIDQKAGTSREDDDQQDGYTAEEGDPDEETDSESETEEEDYPRPDAEYVRIPGSTKDSDHAPGTVGVQYILIVCAPALCEEQLKSAMTATKWFTIRTFYNAASRVGAGNRLKLVRFVDKETIKVVETDGDQLVSLLWADKVPSVTKIMSAAVATFEWVGLYIEDNCEVISYQDAETEWQITTRESPTFNDYVVSVVCTLLGTCYTRKDRIATQMQKRVNAIKAYCGKAKLDINAVTEYTQRAEYIPGVGTGLVSELIGKITCLVSPNETDCNAKVTELMSIPAIREAYDMDDFTEALLVQFRLVAQKVHSTTLRFAIAALGDYKRVAADPLSRMSSQATALRRVARLVDDRPYTGCCHPLPSEFQIAQYPHMCYYGVKVYEKSLTDAEKELFKNYELKSMESKLKPKEMSYIMILVDNTPAMDDAALADWVARLDLATGLEEFHNRSEEKQLAMIKVWRSRDPMPTIYSHLKSLDDAKARSKTNKALREYLADSTTQLINDLWAYNNQNQQKYSSQISEAVRQINSITIDYTRTHLKDKSEIDAHLSPEQMWHEKDYIESTLEKIKEIISRAQGISDGILTN